jgi:hypothetical protein
MSQKALMTENEALRAQLAAAESHAEKTPERRPRKRS